MPVLRSSPPSPFGRKVKIAASVLGLTEQITVEKTDTLDPQDTIRTQNPLGKIPALVLDDGTTLFDSRVIVEYLDHLAGGDRIFPQGRARFDALRLQALTDGLMDAALLQVYEGRFRPADRHDADWVAYQADKVQRALISLETSDLKPLAAGAVPSVGEISLACALGYLDLRFDGTWRAEYPRLVAWLDAFEVAVPAFDETRPQP